MTPKFSIVVPTRNRAGLLRHALATAVAQTRDDLEVVVSDNASDDGTRAVVDAVDDPRVRYVRSGTPLSNAESWEFAVSHAGGEWVTVLGDDDGFVPSLLQRVEPRLESGVPVVGWRTAYYVHPAVDPPWPVEGERNVLTVHPFSGGVQTVDADDQLRRAFAREETVPIPSVRDCFVHRSLLDGLAASGGVFGEPDPHWANAVALLTRISAYEVLDLPLSIMGCSTSQIGASLLTNTRGHDLVREFDTDDLLRSVPLQARTCVNVVAETLLRGRERFRPRLDSYRFDPVRYFVLSRRELTDPRRSSDNGAALEEWRSVIDLQPRRIRAAVRIALALGALGGGLRAVGRRVGPLRARWGAELVSVDGTEAGFADLAAAASHLDQWVIGRADQGHTPVAGVIRPGPTA